MQSTHFTNKYFFAMLAMLVVPISGIGVDIYVPSLPAVSQHFGVDKSLAQLTITTYMIGLGVMQLFAGSLSDSFGRKIPYMVAMLIFIAASLFVPWSQNIHELLFLRFVQGSAVALTVVPMRSVILDLFEGRELNKMATYMTMAWSMGPIIAPAIGGYLQHYAGWQASFYFLAVYSTLIFILTLLYLPETSQHKHAFHLTQIVQRYQQILFHKEYIFGLLINGILYSLVILFGIVGPFLIQIVLHYSPVQFGHVALLMGLAWFLGTMTNRILIDVPLHAKAKICLWAIFIIALIMLSLSLLLPLNIYAIVIPMFVMFWINGIVYPNYFTRNLVLFPTMTGSANALFGSFVFFIAGVSSAFGTLLKANSAIPFACAYVFLIGLSLIIFSLDKHYPPANVEKK